jgi:integrase
MWFARNEAITEQIRKEITEGLPTVKEAIDKSAFDRVAFESFPTIKKWVAWMRKRLRKTEAGGYRAPQESYIENRVTTFRGYLKRYNKHPERFNEGDFDEILNDLIAKGEDSNKWRTVAKAFMDANQILHEFIAVGKPRGYGTLKEMFYPSETVYAILNHVEKVNYEAYVIDKVMWHRGIRIDAVTNAKVENFKYAPALLKVKEKFAEWKTFKMPPEIADLIKTVVRDRTEGNIFSLDENDMAKINKDAVLKFVPNIQTEFKGFHMWNHFFRHMHAQHLLRAIDYNYDKAAAIMQTTSQSLKESYGGIPPEKREEWADEYLRKLDPDVKEY